MVRIEEISYSYGERFSLDTISLDIKSGSLTVLLGPNGSGKTTLLNLVSGTLTPQKGMVTLDGKNISKMKSRTRAKNIAVVRQFVSAPFNYSVFDIVSMGRYAYKKRFETLNSHDVMLVNEFMNEMGIYELQDEYVSKISGGELQRVSLARALCQESELLLLDEPVNHLDIRHRYDILNIIKKRSDQGFTTLCVLHDINLALKYADNLVLIKDGKLFDICSPDDVTKSQLSTLYDVTEHELDSMLFDKRG